MPLSESTRLVLCLAMALSWAARPATAEPRLEALSFRDDGTARGTVLLDGTPLLEVSTSAAAVTDDAAASPGPVRVTWNGRTLTLQGEFPATGRGDGARLDLVHGITAAKHIWMPHLAPSDEHVMGDHAFRSPAIILSGERLAVVLVPDIDDVTAAHGKGWKTWLDYDHPRRRVSLAAGNYKVKEHVLYRRQPVDYRGQEFSLRLHVLVSREPRDVRNPYGLASRFIWSRWGQPLHARGGSQRAPISRYADYVGRWAFSSDGWGETVWQEFEIDGKTCGAPAFIVDVAQHPAVPVEKRRWREQRSIWNQTWFSTQRCANGLFQYAKVIGSEDLERRARLMTRLALSAPQSDGLFPAVYTTAPPGKPKWYQLYKDTAGWDEGRWSNSDRRHPGTSEAACHVVDAAFTARLLLEWSGLGGGDAEAEAYVVKFADRLVRLQRPSGAFPGWVEPDGRVPEILAEGPESAMGTALLFELATRFPQHADAERWKRSAVAALQYLETGPVATGRWEDFETYFSCCRWGWPLIGKKIERNGIYKQNTFSPFWSAEAFLAAYRALGDARHLELGRRCIDELSLFQQVWDPPFIAAPCHGGFGVMNCDGEWNDARQSLFAPLYLEYYRETGNAEYFERGVAALRASFAMLYCPENEQVKKQYELKHSFFGPESYGFEMENIAHGGPAAADGSAIGVFTIFTWGNGAALASAGRILHQYGDVWVDAPRRAAFGVDGCTATVEGDIIEVRDPFGRDALRVFSSDGTQRTVRLKDGVGRLPVSP